MLNQHSTISGNCLNPRRTRRLGLTLIELLVVIVILGLVVIMAMPRLRMINEDRNVREAARTVGSVFAKASQRAYTDGLAGICIELHPNIADVDSVQYAGTALLTLQKLPPYTGDGPGATATRVGDRVLDIPMPYLMDMTNIAKEKNMVRINDTISVNNNSVKYRVADLDPNPNDATLLRITLVDDPVLPDLPVGAAFPFVVHRQPRIQESSRVQLPEGYLIDIRYSGEVRSGARDLPVSANHLPNRTYFHEQSPNRTLTRNRQTMVFFAEDGSIDRYQIPHSGQNIIPSGDLYFFISRYETDVNREQVNSPAKLSSQPDPLDNQNNMWLRIDVRTGASSISYNVPPPNSYSAPATPPDFLPLRIRDARQIAATWQTVAD